MKLASPIILILWSIVGANGQGSSPPAPPAATSSAPSMATPRVPSVDNVFKTIRQKINVLKAKPLTPDVAISVRNIDSYLSILEQGVSLEYRNISNPYLLSLASDDSLLEQSLRSTNNQDFLQPLVDVEDDLRIKSSHYNAHKVYLQRGPVGDKPCAHYNVK